MDETTSYACEARTEMVLRILEGLRDEALELARDIGVESLTAPGGSFVEQCERSYSLARRKKQGSSSVPGRSKVCSPANQENPCSRTYLGDDDGGSYSAR